MNGSMFIGTWWALVPPLLAILLAFVTKEVYSSLFIGSAVGVLLYTGFHPWDAFTSFFEILRNSMNINILIFDILLGMVVVLMAKSGGSAAYGKWAGTKIKTKRSALLATMGLGVLIFVDDYFNCLTVGSVMRPVTDSHKVSRAKLAYIIDSTAAPVCIIAPISSWAAAVNSYVPADAGISGFQLFLRTIPYNLYAILTIAMVFYICYTGFDFGQMKLHEDNAAKGDLFTTGGEEFEQVSEQEVNPNGKVIDLVLPVAVLIVSAIGAMVYTGFLGGADNVISAFAGCDAETSLIFASVVTILFMMALYLPRKVITFKSFMDSLSEGFKLMVPAVTILVFAWTLKGVGDAMGLAQFVGSVVGDHASASIFIPVVLFAARRSKSPVVLLGIPALAGLSTLHAFVPPHPGPLTAIGALNANLGITLALGLIVAIPTVIISGPLFGRLAAKWVPIAAPENEAEAEAPKSAENRPSFGTALSVILLPVVLMLAASIVDLTGQNTTAWGRVIAFLGTPLVALLITTVFAMVALGYMQKFSRDAVNGMVGQSFGSVAGIILIVAAGGGFKQTLVDSGIGDVIANSITESAMNPLIAGWLVAVLIRLATGSATVATVTASGIMVPLAAGMSPTHLALLVLAIGAGSVFFSHLNDAGFWLVKEYFGMSVGQTLKTWSLMETILSVVGLGCVMLLSLVL